ESVFTMAMLGAIEQRAGNLEEARRLQRSAMDRVAVMPVGHPALGHLRAILLAVGARIGFEDGDIAAAGRLAAESFEAAVGTRDMPVIASVGVPLADITARQGAATDAAVMLGAAAQLRGADDETARDVADLTALLRTELGTDRFAELYAQGKALDRSKAIERL